MIRRFTNVISAAAVAAMISGPAAACAQAESTLTTYATTLTQIQPMPSAGEYDGSLRLTVSSDGIVSGSYVSVDQGGFAPVVGGEQNGRYWLDIGGETRLHVYGQVGKDGSLSGVASPVVDDPSALAETALSTFAFVAKPQPN